jgi:hypothetical protein
MRQDAGIFYCGLLISYWGMQNGNRQETLPNAG